jgi:hypothetical protein
VNIELALRALAEIDADPTLSAQQKLRQQAIVMRDYRAILGEPESVRGNVNRTGYGRTFGQSFARALGRGLVNAFFKLFK